MSDLSVVRMPSKRAVTPVTAISVDPSARGRLLHRQVFEVVGPAVRQLDWGMELVEGDHGLRD